MNFDAPTREALIAAGGCVHTPNPFMACDTCGRTKLGGLAGATVAYSFVAETVDGGLIHKADSPSVDHLPLDKVKTLVVLCDDPRIPRVTITVDPDQGDRCYRFRRTAMRLAARGTDANTPPKGSLIVEVLEIRRHDGSAVRLYLHPTRCPILSTQDLYF